MTEGRMDANFMAYFPNSCYRRYPPKDYLWKTYATLEPEKFKDQYNQNLDRLLLRFKRPTTLQILDVHKQLMVKRKEENLKLSLALKRSGIGKNLSYLKRTKKIKTSRGTLDNFIQRRDDHNSTSEIRDQEHHI